MGPKYSAGNKVRIKYQNFPNKILESRILQYENMTGEIIETTSTVAFIGSPWSNLRDSGECVTLYHYTVRINDQVTLSNVTEEYLEIMQ